MRFLFAFLLTVKFASATEVPSGHRVALLMGNGKYDGLTVAPAKASLDRVEAALAQAGLCRDACGES